MDNKHEEFGQELVDVVRPSESKALEDWTQVDDIKETAESSQNTTTQSTFVTTSIQPIRTTSPSTTTKEESTTTNNSRTDDFPILGLPRTQIVAPTPIAAAANKPATTTAAEDEATFTLPPPSPPTPVPESNMTTTDTLSLLETEQQHPLDTQQQQQQPDIQLTESTAPKSPDVLPADALATNSQVDGHSNNKRTSVAATMAQSILGDRLDDFTEKLAFIKKNIIMSLEDEENWDEDDRVLKPSLSESNKRR